MKNFFLVIPTRDRIDFLSNLLLDLNAFEKHIARVVIVDQSQTSIENEIHDLALQYPFTLVMNDRNHSVNHSRNRALEFYNNEDWLFFLDDDLRIPSIVFEQIIKELKPNVIDVLIPGIRLKERDRQTNEYNSILETIAKPHDSLKGRFRLQVYSGLNIVKSSIFKEAGFYFDENFSIWGDDWDYGMRLLKAGANMYFQPRILVDHLDSYWGGQRDKSKTLNVELEKHKLYFYFYRKHFSKTVFKQHTFLHFFIALKKMLKNGEFSNFVYLIKGYRMSKLITKTKY